MKYFFVIMTLALSLSACKTPKLEGACMHPAVMGGMPFPIPEGSYFTDGGTLNIVTKDGTVRLVGAACVYHTVK